MKASDTIVTPIHRDGRIFVLLFAAATLLFFWMYAPLGWVGVVLTLWCAYFFRDPDRVVPGREGVMVAPADGVVSAIVKRAPPPELNMGQDPMTRVSIFLNVFNVHVPRSPVGGRVERLQYVPGLFINAADDNASEVNERQLIRFDDGGNDVAMAIVAGLVARRIICDLDEGAEVARGARIGMIRFGSRTDLWIPDSYSVYAEVGQTMVAGETVIAERKA